MRQISISTEFLSQFAFTKQGERFWNGYKCGIGSARIHRYLAIVFHCSLWKIKLAFFISIIILFYFHLTSMSQMSINCSLVDGIVFIHLRPQPSDDDGIDVAVSFKVFNLVSLWNQHTSITGSYIGNPFALFVANRTTHTLNVYVHCQKVNKLFDSSQW